MPPDEKGCFNFNEYKYLHENKKFITCIADLPDNKMIQR